MNKISQNLELHWYYYVFLFFCITFITGTIESGYYFLLPYIDGIGINKAHWGGLIMGICYGVSFLIRPFVPIIERKMGLEKMLWFGYFCYFISTLGIALFANRILSVILWRGVTGLGLSLVGVSLMGYQIHLIPEALRGRSLALITTAYSLPSLAIVPVFEYIIKNSYFKVYIFFFPFLVAAGLIAVINLPSVKHLSLEQGEKQKIAPSYPELLKRPDILIFVCSISLFAFTDAGQLTFVLLADELGIPASYFFSVSAAIALICRVLCGKLLDILPRKYCSTGAAIITATAMLLVTYAQTPTQLMFFGAIYGIGMGFGFPALMCMTLDLGGKLYVTHLAVLFGLIYSGIFFIAPMIMGFFFSMLGSPIAAYRLVNILISAAAALLIIISVRKHKSITKKYNTGVI